MFEKPPAPAEVAFELFQQREQMDRLSLYQDRNGIWQCPKWADTSELIAQIIPIFLKNSTEEEKSSFIPANHCSSLKDISLSRQIFDVLEVAAKEKA